MGNHHPHYTRRPGKIVVPKPSPVPVIRFSPGCRGQIVAFLLTLATLGGLWLWADIDVSESVASPVVVAGLCRADASVGSTAPVTSHQTQASNRPVVAQVTTVRHQHPKRLATVRATTNQNLPASHQTTLHSSMGNRHGHQHTSHSRTHSHHRHGHHRSHHHGHHHRD